MLDRLEAVRKPTVALVDGFAMGSGLAISAACDLRVITPDAKFGMPIARTVGNCLSMGNYARLAQALGAPRLKDVMFRARGRSAPTRRWRSASPARSTDDAEAHVTELCERLAGHSPTTLWVTKEALRRARVVPRATTSSSRPTAARASAPTSKRFLNAAKGPGRLGGLQVLHGGRRSQLSAA